MKRVSKAPLLVLVLALAVGVFAGCNRLKGLTKQSEAIGTPETVAVNKEPYSTTLIPYESAEQPLSGNYADSPYYKSLNGEWDFSLVLNPNLVPEGFATEKYLYTVEETSSVRMNEEQSASWSKISVPSNWEMQGFDAPSYTYNTYTWGSELVAPNISESYNPVGLYRNMIEVPSDWFGRQVYVTFEGVSSCVYVYVNGILVGYAEDSYTGKTFNITEAVEFGKENLVVFEVYKYCDGSYLEANDSIKFGGIYRDVYLYAAPETQIRDFTYDMQMSGDDALMNVTVSLASYSEPARDLTVDLSVYDSAGNCILQPTQVGFSASFSEKIATTANAYLGETGARITIPSPKLWSAETPNLYTVVLELKDGNKVLDTVGKRIGFKTVGVSLDDNGRQTFVVNDETVTLRGILYNENSAVYGMAMTRDEMIADIKLMKELNINAVRSPGRPLSEDFISLCDEYGLYVIDDMSLNSNPYSNKDDSSIPGDQTVWQSACLDRLLNVVYRDKNSASVIMWSIGNDSGTGSNFSLLRNWLTAADSRMIIYDDDSTASDLVICSDLSLNDFVQMLNDTDNKKAVLLQDTRGGLLNNGGNFSSYSKLMGEYANFQGGFFSYWTDNAVYWPSNTSDASRVLQTSPYSEETASSYMLAYAGTWGGEAMSSATDSYMALSGIVSADRQLQSDAIELKNALSPVYISAEDLTTGSFKVTNRNSFTDFASTYEISYEVTDGKNIIKSGTVSGLDVNPGESATFTVNYGVDPTQSTCYIYFTVKYLSAPSWAESNDVTVLTKQFAPSEDVSVPKDGSVQDHDGGELKLSVFQVPEVYLSSYTFSRGQFYVSNRSDTNFNDIYSVSWVVYERHAYWEKPRWVVYDEGALSNFNVPAGATNQLITLPIDTDGAASGATYAAHLILTTKIDVAGVPAGTQFVYTINADASTNIPFKLDASRNPVIVDFDDSGNVEEAIPIYGPAPGDEEPESSPDDLLEIPEAPASYTGSSVILLENDNVTMRINADTGLITQYTVDGKEIFSGASGYPSMISSLMRIPTGGDLMSSSVTSASLNVLKKLTSEYATTKTLPEGYSITKVSANQYRIKLDYLWVTYPVKSMRAFSYDTYYTVVYDIYSDGEIQVSVKYEPTVESVAPIELSSVMTLTSDFTTMSWFGMGPGETYGDKVGDAKVGTYKDIAIADQFGEFLYNTSSGDKTELRWMALEREDGSGIVITSDSKLFAANVSNRYPWNASSSAPVLRVIGQQRGISANTLFDQEYSDADYVEPGVNYTYSFRIVPVSAGYNADQISRTVLNSGTNLTAGEALDLNNKSFALTNAASASTYLSVSEDGAVTIASALGNASQTWIKEASTDIGVADAFRIKSVSKGLYLSPVSKDDSSVTATEAELTLATYRGLAWQNWTYNDSQLFINGYTLVGSYSLYIAGAEDTLTVSGARLALKAARSDTQSLWTIIADPDDPNSILIQSSKSGKYLTVVDSLTYTNPLTELQALHARKYPVSINWNNATFIAMAKPYTTADSEEWVGSDYYVTQWDLLPADSQMWTFVPVDGGYKIVNKSTGNALVIENGSLVESASAAENAVWSVVDCDGMYGIVNKTTGQALTLRSVNGNTVLTVQEWKSLAIQKWDFSSEKDLKVNIQAGANWY